MGRSRIVTDFILQAVEEHPTTVAKLVVEGYGITRQAANRHLARLVRDGILTAVGNTRNRRYGLAILGRADVTEPVTPDLDEDRLWRRHALPVLEKVPENVLDICQYGFTEIVNNVKDHSESRAVTALVRRTARRVDMRVTDQGVGVFRKIKVALGLEDERHAVFELTKGKLTTDPDRHTGEGIFFTSRAFDFFAIGSGKLRLAHMRAETDFLIEVQDDYQGTEVLMQIELANVHTLKEVFDLYASDQDDYAFQRTNVVVALAQAEGDKLVSRSQATRVMARLDRFREVVLDFEGVKSIGPAFADEIFRIFVRENPSVRLVPINTSDEVARMIRRAQSTETR